MQTNWCVISGPPSSGKTSIINRLHQEGFATVPDPAREIAKKKPSIKKESREFQKQVWNLSLKNHGNLNRKKLVFFDYGLPDNIVFQELNSHSLNDCETSCWSYRYSYVFILKPIHFSHDGFRDDHASLQTRIEDRILTKYKYFDYCPIILSSDKSLIERLSIIKKTCGISI